MQNKRARGFTLIELMIVVAIISIIAAVSFPSYKNYVTRGKRAEGRAALLDLAARQQRYYSDNNAYITLEDAGMDRVSETGHYKLSIDLGKPGMGNQKFTLRATPATFEDPDCGYLEITNAGTKSSQSGTVADCWGR